MNRTDPTENHGYPRVTRGQQVGKLPLESLLRGQPEGHCLFSQMQLRIIRIDQGPGKRDAKRRRLVLSHTAKEPLQVGIHRRNASPCGENRHQLILPPDPGYQGSSSSTHEDTDISGDRWPGVELDPSQHSTNLHWRPDLCSGHSPAARPTWCRGRWLPRQSHWSQG